MVVVVVVAAVIVDDVDVRSHSCVLVRPKSSFEVESLLRRHKNLIFKNSLCIKSSMALHRFGKSAALAVVLFSKFFFF